MRMRMNNEDEISRQARLRKEARELEQLGVKAEANEEEEIRESEEELGKEEETFSEAIPAVQKATKRASARKVKGRRK